MASPPTPLARCAPDGRGRVRDTRRCLWRTRWGGVRGTHPTGCPFGLPIAVPARGRGAVASPSFPAPNGVINGRLKRCRLGQQAPPLVLSSRGTRSDRRRSHGGSAQHGAPTSMKLSQLRFQPSASMFFHVECTGGVKEEVRPGGVSSASCAYCDAPIGQSIIQTGTSDESAQPRAFSLVQLSGRLTIEV